MFKDGITKKALLLTSIGLVVAGGVWYLRPNPKTQSADDAKIDLSALMVAPAVASEEIKPVFVRYVSIDDTPQNKALKQQQKNLAKTGSLSGGVLSTEFKQATHAKMTYRFGRKQPLSFEPTKLAFSDFILTGRQYEGVLGSDGFDGLYRLFENPHNKARFEILEVKIPLDAPVTIYQELLNKHIHDTPIMYEHLTDKKGVFYQNARFVHQDRLYTMSAKGMSRAEFDELLGVILQDNTDK
ncbi:MAG: hypothetical protein Q4B81_06635 [Moraxella sp.]|nr:hypothetical protein [Moraxella sp.]